MIERLWWAPGIQPGSTRHSDGSIGQESHKVGCPAAACHHVLLCCVSAEPAPGVGDRIEANVGPHPTRFVALHWQSSLTAFEPMASRGIPLCCTAIQ